MRWHAGFALGWMLRITATAAGQEKLPASAVARLGVARVGAAGGGLGPPFPPGGRKLVVAFETKDRQPNVILFDIATGLERKRLNIRACRHIAMARHKPWMAVDTDLGFEVWDLAKEARVQEWEYPECVDAASAVAISPDGTEVVAATPKLLRWNAVTAAPLGSVRS